MSIESEEYHKNRLFSEEINNKNEFDSSINALTAIKYHESKIKEFKENSVNLQNRVTNDVLISQIEREKLRINRAKRSLNRYIDTYLQELEDSDIDYEKYIPSNKRLKLKYASQIAYGVLNDI